MDFLLGTHEPSWLSRSRVPLFISAVRLRLRRAPRAVCKWALDSGGFSELSLRGLWSIPMEQYVDEVLRWIDKIGPLEWAAIQDWMCEPWILEKTGKTVDEHQRLTIQSLLDLRERAPDVPWAPVVQGWKIADYVRHVEMYAAQGVDLREHAIVGVGSVCRRQGTNEGAAIMRELARGGLRLHAFGIKTQGLAMFGDRIASADSMAWSFQARKQQRRLPGHTHKTCANCFDWAMQWRERMLAGVDDRISAAGPIQVEMPW